jgi:hypothetical protein
MTLERFDGVGGAAGIITARRGQQGTERYLIRTHEQNENRSHQVSVDPMPERCRKMVTAEQDRELARLAAA